MSISKFLIMYAIFVLWVTLPILYLHRSLTHNQFEFHPFILAVIRIIFWLSKPNYKPEDDRFWVAVHLKHHKFTDTPQDPHSPHVISPMSVITGKRTFYPIKELYRETTHLRIPNLWIDTYLEKYPCGKFRGRFILLLIFLCCFSWPGILLWLLCIPAWGAFLNYAGHCWYGYTNATSIKQDKSKNLPYLWFLFFGEEYHANHHRWPGRANFAVKWWEIDIGYQFLCFLSLIGLVKFK